MIWRSNCMFLVLSCACAMYVDFQGVLLLSRSIETKWTKFKCQTCEEHSKVDIWNHEPCCLQCLDCTPMTIGFPLPLFWGNWWVVFFIPFFLLSRLEITYIIGFYRPKNPCCCGVSLCCCYCTEVISQAPHFPVGAMPSIRCLRTPFNTVK